MKRTLLAIGISCLISHISYLATASVVEDVAYTITEGWNAIHLPVTPEVSADELFADWPTDSVGYYDQAAFQRTAQFDAESETYGAIENPIKMWYRGQPAKSGFHYLTANGIYIFNSTNVDNLVRTVRGTPAAMRTVWHVAISTNAPLNFVGVSTDGSKAKISEDGYFRGLDTGWTVGKNIVRYPWGFDTVPTLDNENNPFLDEIYGDHELGNHGVVAMDAPRSSTWSGAFFVSPEDGVDYWTNAVRKVVTIRNDAGTNRLVGISLRASANGLPVPKLSFTCSALGQTYTNLTTETKWAAELAAGETLTMKIMLDRTDFAEVPVGTEYGAILDIADVTPELPTHFKTSVPIVANSDGGAFVGGDWPNGLWSVGLALDRVGGLKAGSTLQARVLVHVDEWGQMNLLQRARVGERRISSVVLPTDQPVLPGSGAFGGEATFTWTVGEKSRVNPFYHAKHPDHDGLDYDFKDTLPSGDSFTNYVATVKPELFSISNRLEFSWSGAGSEWTPQETLSGICTWYLYCLRHEHDGVIKTSGSFTMKRVSKADLEAIKEEF